ncbi:translational activator of GCN4, partial [Globomyces sp. JEL0801]
MLLTSLFGFKNTNTFNSKATLELFILLHSSRNELSNFLYQKLTKVANKATDAARLYNYLRLALYLWNHSIEQPVNNLQNVQISNYISLISNLFNWIDQSTSPKSSHFLKSGYKEFKKIVKSNPTNCIESIKLLLKKTDVFHSLVIGAAVDALVDINQSALLEPLNDVALTFIFKVVFASKTAIGDNQLIALNSLVSQFLTKEKYESDIFNSFDRFLLRSPEVLIKAVTFDVGKFFSSKFADLLLNQFKSNNESIRSDAMALFTTLVQKSDSDNLLIVIDIVLKAKSPTPEQRILFFDALCTLPSEPQLASKLLNALPQFISKEANEQAVMSLMKSFTAQLSSVLDSIDDSGNSEIAFKFLLKGLKDGKSLRKPCILSMREILSRSVKNIPDQILKEIFNYFSAFTINMQALGNSLTDPKKDTATILEAYCGIANLLHLHLHDDSFDIDFLFQDVLNVENVSSIFFSERFYSKLPLDEHVFYYNMLLLLTQNNNLFNRFGQNQDQLASSLVWIAVNGSTDARAKVSTLTSPIAQSSVTLMERFTFLIRKGLTLLFSVSRVSDILDSFWKDLPPRSSSAIGQRCLVLIFSLFPTGDISNLTTSVIEQSLVEFLILCCHPLMINSQGLDLWIRLCFRSNISPNFIQKYPTAIDGWLSLENVDAGLGGMSVDYPASFRVATTNAIKLTVQIVPDLVISKVTNWSLDILLNETYAGISVDDVLIWKTPEGQLFFNPLANSDVQTKGLTKDQLWELELKLELQAKNKTAKLSKADQVIYDTQLKKEKSIRDHVETLYQPLKSALDALESIIDGVLFDKTEVSIERIQYMSNELINGVLSVILRESQTVKLGKDRKHSGPLCEKRIFQLYQKLCRIFAKQLEHLDYEKICATILLAIGVDDTSATDIIPDRFLDQTQELITSINSLCTEGDILSPSCFTFIFTLISAVILREGRIARIKEKGFTDLVMLASDLLILHTTLGGKESLVIPRKEMVKCLLNSSELYPRLRSTSKSGLIAISLEVSNLELSETVENVDPITEDVLLVLLDGLLNKESCVREACLASLIHLTVLESISDTFDVRVWLSQFDADELVSSEAMTLWNEVHEVEPLLIRLIPNLLSFVVFKFSDIRLSAGKALCDALKQIPEMVEGTLQSLYDLYAVKAAPPAPEYDDYGMVIPESLNKPDEWESRSGIAKALESCKSIITSRDSVLGFFRFLIVDQALGDINPKVQQEMLHAGLLVLESSGKLYIKELLDLFDEHLSKPSKDSEKFDQIREATVILMGTLAQYLDSTDSRITDTVSKLIETLKTPSEVVQIAVSECLPALIKVNHSQVAQLVKDLLDMLFTSEKYGHRRGAAYGIAGIVKGKGVSSLKDYLIMAHLKEAVEDKRNVLKREGALFAFETLSLTLGRTFEPYVIQILPYLLVCYGDSNRQIRDATEDACRVIMSKLSAHCVKLLLPSLLNGLQERAFRTKIGSIEVMASMSALAPKQLSQSLPTIVPKICDALGDSHQKVQEAARDALEQFGKVIKNPEIQELVPVLIGALVNPNHKTQTALSALLDTTFVHYIDAPSLALLVPIIHRGLKERSAETKKKAAQIMGNMSSLTEPRDLIPYLDTLLPPLKEVLVDPVPETRGTAARAFGSMVEKLGEDRFPGLVNELLDTLQSEASSVDRSGAAQGLSEVLAGVGIPRLEGLLPDIINNANSVKTYVREGFTTLLVYLPTTFGEKFTPYISQVVPTMLEGLADESDTVREAALHVGRVIVRNYAKTAVNLLLPQLENGLFHENWRIRQNSVQLIGDLIFRITGVSQQLDVDENDEGFGTEAQRTTLKAALGEARYETVLSSLYIVRADSSGIVRQCSIGVWKAIVTNTPKTLKQILPVLMKIVLSSLASSSYEKRTVAARTLGDLVRRLGESIMTLLIPILKDGLDSDDEDTREGVCIGLSEMMTSAGRLLAVEFMDQCTPLVKKALVDSSATVRAGAAQAFDILHQQMGARAIDDIIPNLLANLQTDSDGYALEGLKEIMAVRSNVVFPVLIPTLLTEPITAMNAQALGALVSVAGTALNRRLDTIINALFVALENNSEASEDIRSALNVIMASIEEDGVYRIMNILTEAITERSLSQQLSATQCLCEFFESTTESFEEFIPEILPLLIAFLAHDSEDLVKVSWNAIDILVKRLHKEELPKYVSSVRKGIREAEQQLGYGENIAGFNLPKGIAPFVQIFLQGLMNGSGDIRESCAYGLGDLINRSSEISLKPFVTQITGPLIRVIGDRFLPAVKTAILSTLGLLLSKVPSMLKPFLPQLQRTFVKSLTEAGSSAIMRTRTAQCLSLLIPLQTRLDPLVMELIQAIKVADEDIKKSIWEALYGLLHCVSRDSGKSINETSQQAVQGLLLDTLLLGGENDSLQRAGASKCFASLCEVLPLEKAKDITIALIAQCEESNSYTAIHGMLLVFANLYSESTIVTDVELEGIVLNKAIESLSNSKNEIIEASVLLAGRILENGSVPQSLLEALISLINSTSNSSDVRRDAIVVLKTVAKRNPELVPVLMRSVRDRNIPVKLAAERALVYALQVTKGMTVVESYLKTIDAASARSIGDYAKRILTKIGERDSDDEEE